MLCRRGRVVSAISEKFALFGLAVTSKEHKLFMLSWNFLDFTAKTFSEHPPASLSSQCCSACDGACFHLSAMASDRTALGPCCAVAYHCSARRYRWSEGLSLSLLSPAPGHSSEQGLGFLWLQEYQPAVGRKLLCEGRTKASCTEAGVRRSRTGAEAGSSWIGVEGKANPIYQQWGGKGRQVLTG